MPMYQCFAPPESFNDGKRAALARTLTTIHCSLTGAPPTFVHIVFRDGQPSWSQARLSILGGIRAGRGVEVTDALVSQMTHALAEAAGVAASEVAMRTVETPASWIMEGGRVLPEPGDEAEWLAAEIAVTR
jgi:phenylpyruvate tautomerase PptA (4-oxalocrotonate tautomerase family)